MLLALLTSQWRWYMDNWVKLKPYSLDRKLNKNGDIVKFCTLSEICTYKVVSLGCQTELLNC